MKKIYLVVALALSLISLKAQDTNLAPCLTLYRIGVCDGYMDFWFTSIPKKIYEIQTSTNLIDWTVYGEVMADTDFTMARVLTTENKQFVRLKLINK